MIHKNAWTNSFQKYKKLLTEPDLTFEFQTYTLKLLAYNYLIVLLIANQDVQWNYPFKGTGLAERLGEELIEPTVLSKFGFCFRLMTVIMNTITIITVCEPNYITRKYLLPCILWNFYTIVAVTENVIEIMWTMYELEVPGLIFATTFLVAFFMLAFHTKLTLQVIRFYEYLNYMSANTNNSSTTTSNTDDIYSSTY